MKTHSTQRKHSAVARASRGAGRTNYTAWSGGIAALLDGNPLINTWLQPGVSRAKQRRAVSTARRLHKKPLKRFPAPTRHDTGLKPGVNEKQIIQTASEQSNILPTVLAKSPSSISQTPSAKLKTCGTVSRKSADAQKCQTVSGESPVAISATPLRKLDAKQIIQTLSGQLSTLQIRQTPSAESGIYATPSRKSEIDFDPRTLELEIEKMRRLLESPARRLRRH